MISAEKHLELSKAALLKARAASLLRDSVDAGSAGLWGETIRHAMIIASLRLVDEARELQRG